MRGSNFVRGLIAGASMFAMAGAAAAQDNATLQAESQQDGAEENGPSEVAAASSGIDDNVIIVTAQNRAENVQDVPIAISVVGGEALRDAGVTDFREVERIAPAVNITQDANYTRVAVRGVGTNSNDESQDQSIAINIDGEYLNRANILNVSLFDLERVEVLRGPQGTLYGRNATGGAINFITRKPDTNEFGANGNVTYGNYNQVTVEGGVDIPFGIGGVRLAGVYNNHDGYFYHPNLDASSGTQDTMAGRISLRLRPIDGLTIDVAGEYVDVDNVIAANAFINFNSPGNGPGANCSQNGFVEVAPATPGTQCIPQNTDLLRTIDRARYNAPISGLSRNQQESMAIRGRVQYDFGPAVFTYTGGFRDTAQDADITLQPAYKFLEFGNNTQTQSHELRLNGGNPGGIQWQGGLFYYNEQIDAIRGLFNQLIGPNGSFINFFTRETEAVSYAAFAQVDVPLTDELALVGGIRYTRDDRTGVYGNYGFRFNTGPTLPTTPPPVVLDLNAEGDQITWLAGINYRPDQNTLLYAKVATGYKAGGFDSVGTYDAETNTAYEIGTKLNFGPRGRNLFNVAGYYYDYTDLQVPVLLNPAVGGQVFNAGSATIWGIEAETVIRLNDNNIFSASINYLNAEYNDLLASYAVFCVGCSANGVGDLDNDPNTVTQPNLAGNRLPQAPEFVITLGYDHIVDLGSAGSLTASAFTRFKSEYFLDSFNFRDSEQEAYTQTDLSLKYEPVDGRWSVQAYVRNLENTRPLAYATFVSAGPDDLYNFGFGTPRTYGVRLGFDF